MRKISGTALAACALVEAVQTGTRVQGELVQLVTLTRHGSRAPNTVIRELCPANEDNLAAYNVPPGQLTEVGMKQALKLGGFLRETYVETLGFLPPSLGGSGEGFSSRFMSDPAERCLQTAQAMTQGLFPNGTGPPGFPNQPVAVQTEQKAYANLLAAAHGACLPRQLADNKVYDESRGRELIAAANSTTEVVAKACGTPLEDYATAHGGKEGLVLGVKDVGDMLDFDEQQGLPRLASVSEEVHKKMTALAFTLLQERYYSSPQQVAYWAGALPSQLLDDFQASSDQHSIGKKPNRLYIGYHGHRELLYGLAHLLGWSFDVPGAPTALGTSSVPPGTTMFFELHYRDPQADEASQQADHKKDSASLTPDGLGDAGNGDVGDEEGGYYYVRTFTWTPQFGQQETVLDVCSNNKAGEGCRLSTLRNAVLDSTIDSGSWEQICHHVPFTQAEEIAKKAVYNTGNAVGTDDDGPGSVDQPSPSRTIRMGAVVATVAAVLLAWLGAVVVKTKWLSSDRRSEIYEPVR